MPVLSLLIFSPLILAGAIACIPSIKPAKWLGLLGSIAIFLVSIGLWYQFDGQSSELQFSENYQWLPQYGVSYFVAVDGLNLLLLVLTTFLTPLICICQWDMPENGQKRFFALLLALESTMLGALVALDLVLFYVFWEAMLIPMYFIIGIWGGPRRIYATTKFFIYTAAGSLLMLAAALVLYNAYFSEFGYYSTKITDLYRLNLASSIQSWLFLAFAIAFAIKVPVWPFHTWLPDAHVEAPTVGSVILAGIMLKMGTYGFLRYTLPLFPMAVIEWAPLIVGLGIVGIIYGSLVAWVQVDAKKMIAYSSVSHLGFVVIGSFAIHTVSNTISEEALTGSVYQMINHGISTGALFFLIGILYEQRHTRMLADFGGLAKNLPWFATFFIIATLSAVGLPGTGGFIGEFLILLGLFQTNAFAGILATSGVVLGAIYMLTLCRALLFGPITQDENHKLKDLGTKEFLYLGPMIALIIVMGVYPNLFLDKMKPSIKKLAQQFTEYRPEESSQTAEERP